MNKTVTSLVLLLLFVPQFLLAQERYLDQIKVEDVRVTHEGEEVGVAMNINLNNLKIRSNDVILLSPALRMNGKDIVKVLPPLQVSGRTRSIVLNRMAESGIAREWHVAPELDITRKNGSRQSIAYSHRLPFQSYMTEAELVFLEVVHGCADCFVHEGEKVLLTPFVEQPYEPSYMLTYITPEVEPVKARADRHTATFNFVVAKHDLIRDYKNNAAEFARVDKVVSEVVKNKDLTITEFAVIGYASPEGGFEYNRALAGRRANSFAEYLVSAHGVQKSQFKVSGHGEDWNGLKDAVSKSSLSNKDAILDIIAFTANPDARDAKIRALDGGQTYNNLLQNFYPPLRRTEYVIAYNVRAFDVEEAKEIIKSNPKLLSLNEMYLVAKSYPADSKEFKEVFDIATRLFPNEPVAMINASAADIEGGNYQAAIDRLSKLSNHAEALNNLGIAYARKGNLEQAKASFQKAASMGSTNAQHNLNELTKLQESL
ncbi:hypothetical protein IX332_000110 [Porphyromonas levii]|uniref:OmpA family protein n=1 Tax=Porphyromonas levii TaxID=28114 RepID=UPI001B8C1EEA|nr:DUF3868 domain-containing protein [Porphyromonas levii]MBR8728807.1 hypothetical protein [Porphyromonas levii]MBR8759718.1 hypothetical protein [Porphyromonas levii]